MKIFWYYVADHISKWTHIFLEFFHPPLKGHILDFLIRYIIEDFIEKSPHLWHLDK